jgi:carboxypeptidase Q
MGLPKNGAEIYANYAKNSKDEKHILAFESDLGTTKPWGFGFTGNPEATYEFIYLYINI